MLAENPPNIICTSIRAFCRMPICVVNSIVLIKCFIFIVTSQSIRLEINVSNDVAFEAPLDHWSIVSSSDNSY